MKRITTVALSVACLLGLSAVAGAQSEPTINEIVMNDVSTDTHEFFEICGEPGTDLTAFTFVVIEGEGTTAKGTIDRAFSMGGIIGASGFYVLGSDAITCRDEPLGASIENGGNTFLLVRNFTGAVGQDIDADDDGVADGPIGTIVDGVGTAKPSSGDANYYGVPVLGPDTGDDGSNDFDAAGLARCADCDGAWGMICLAGTEGDPVCDINNMFNPYNVTNASPCQANACGVISVEQESWGKIKAEYR